MTARWRAAIVILVALCAALSKAAALGDDGFDSPMAAAVRAATQAYRLALWAVHDGYVQTTDYIPGFGTMYTNHDRFDPSELSQPTVLVYDEAGRLTACGYQFARSGPYAAPFRGVPASVWYSIPKHVHYNVLEGGVMHYGQAPWPNDDPPTLANLRAHNYVPADGTLTFAIVHPAVRAMLIWAWRANDNGLYAGANPALP